MFGIWHLLVNWSASPKFLCIVVSLCVLILVVQRCIYTIRSTFRIIIPQIGLP